MPDQTLSAAREVLRCKECGATMIVLSLEAKTTADRCANMLRVVIQQAGLNALLRCDDCSMAGLKRALEELKPEENPT